MPNFNEPVPDMRQRTETGHDKRYLPQQAGTHQTLTQRTIQRRDVPAVPYLTGPYPMRTRLDSIIAIFLLI